MNLVDLPKPQEIKDAGSVCGRAGGCQESLSVAVYNHYKRVNAGQKQEEEIELQKQYCPHRPYRGRQNPPGPNPGPGVECSLAIADATSLTEAGYVGRWRTSCSGLFSFADYDLEKAGDHLYREIDKIARKTDNPSITRGCLGEGAQQALPRSWKEWASVPLGWKSIPPGVHADRYHRYSVYLRGAFDGLENHIEPDRQEGIGFGAD